MAMPCVSEYNRELVKGFSAGEIETINRFLDTIIQRFEIAPDNCFKTHLSGVDQEQS
jgi:hypothetical protein